VRVLHVTDPHLFADPAASLRGTVTHASLSAVLEHFRGSDWPADLVAVTGDLVQDDSEGAYERCRELLATLDLPVHCVPGNHDVRELMQAALSDPPFTYCGIHRQQDWTIVGIDSCLEGSAGGRVSQAELERLATLLEAADSKHVLVCVHHPPLALDSRWLDRVGLENGAELLELATHAGCVRGILFGHAHQAFDGRHGEVAVIGTPSTCRQFRPGSDDFALDDRPPAYRRVSLEADGSIESELIWLARTPPAGHDGPDA